jgi:hypothetical protein
VKVAKPAKYFGCPSVIVKIFIFLDDSITNDLRTQERSNDFLRKVSPHESNRKIRKEGKYSRIEEIPIRSWLNSPGENASTPSDSPKNALRPGARHESTHQPEN